MILIWSFFFLQKTTQRQVWDSFSVPVSLPLLPALYLVMPYLLYLYAMLLISWCDVILPDEAKIFHGELFVFDKFRLSGQKIVVQKYSFKDFFEQFILQYTLLEKALTSEFTVVGFCKDFSGSWKGRDGGGGVAHQKNEANVGFFRKHVRLGKLLPVAVVYSRYKEIKICKI